MNSVEVLKNEIKDLEIHIKIRKDALVALQGFHGINSDSETNSKTKNSVSSKPRRKNISISEKQVYRTEKDKKYLESVIIEALSSVKRPKNAKWVFDNTRNKQGLRTHAGIALKMRQMADKGVLSTVKPKSRKEGMFYEVDVSSSNLPPSLGQESSKKESQKIHIGHGTGKGATNVALGEGI